jgi:hypothetical protein
MGRPEVSADALTLEKFPYYVIENRASDSTICTTDTKDNNVGRFCLYYHLKFLIKTPASGVGTLIKITFSRVILSHSRSISFGLTPNDLALYSLVDEL